MYGSVVSFAFAAVHPAERVFMHCGYGPAAVFSVTGFGLSWYFGVKYAGSTPAPITLSVTANANIPAVGEWGSERD